MHTRRGWAAALCAAVASFLTAVPVRAGLIATGWPRGILYDIDFKTGAASNPRNTGLNWLMGITQGRDGYLYGLAGARGALYRIDPLNGASKMIVGIGPSSVLESDLDFDPVSGKLFTVQSTSRHPGVPSDLVRFDTSTGESEVVGALDGHRDPSAIAFDDGGTLYVLDTASGELLTIDPATAEVRTSVRLSLGLGSVAGMDFDPASGALYVADGKWWGTDSLYELNPETGLLTLIGASDSSKRLAGLQFVPDLDDSPAGGGGGGGGGAGGGGSPGTPEPTTVSLVVLGGLTLLRRRRS